MTEIGVSDGTRMGAWVALPPGEGRRPGLLVLQEIFGVNSHIRAVTERLAAAGYVAVAPELFHRADPGFVGSYDDIDGGRACRDRMTPEGTEADLRSALAWLRTHPRVDASRIGVIGFCLCGHLAFRTHLLEPLRAAVSFYGGGLGQDVLSRTGDGSGAVLMLWGGRDGYIPPESRRAVEDALASCGRPWRSVVFGDAGHGFFCDERGSYDPHAAREAWELTLSFLREWLDS